MKDPGPTRDPTDDPDEAFGRAASSHHQQLLDMCARKGDPFATWHHAELAAKRTNRKRIKDRYVAPFICPVCKGIHVGSQPKRINRKRIEP
jgi:hypothetical protein